MLPFLRDTPLHVCFRIRWIGDSPTDLERMAEPLMPVLAVEGCSLKTVDALDRREARLPSERWETAVPTCSRSESTLTRPVPSTCDLNASRASRHSRADCDRCDPAAVSPRRLASREDRRDPTRSKCSR